MARRKKVDGIAVASMTIVGVLCWGIAALDHAVGTAMLTALIGGLIVFVIWIKIARRKARIAFLMGKYSNPQIVEMIMQRRFWEGQTAEQLGDSLGQPYAKDDQRLKTFKREVWKYNRTGKNRYALRITLENGIVAGWDHKN